MLYLENGSIESPDSAQLSITGDLEFQALIQSNDWNQSQCIAAKFDAGGGSSIAWSLVLLSNSALRLEWSDDGSGVDEVADSTVNLAETAELAEGDSTWVRFTLDVNNGASGFDVEFFYGTDGTNWTQLGNTVTGGNTTSIFDNNGSFELGARVGTLDFQGVIFEARLFDGIGGTLAANPIFSDPAQGWTVGDDAGDSGTDAQGNVWTLMGDAEIVATENIQGAMVVLEAGFGVTPFGSPAWTSITSDLRSVDLSRGRQYELDRIEAGTMTVTLGNNHGNYNSHNTQGAYYPNVKPTVPIRLRAVYDGVVYPLWSGFVERWPVSFPAKVDSVVQVQCVDLFKLLALAKAAAADRESVVDALSPVAHWRFGDTSDRTGNGHTLTFSGSPTAGDATGVWQGDVGTTFDGTDDFATVASDDAVERQSADRSYELWVKPGSTIGTVLRIGEAAGSGVSIRIVFNPANGLIIVAAFPSSGSVVAPYTVDEWVHVVVTDDLNGGTYTRSLYVDGVLVNVGNVPDITGTFQVTIGSTDTATFDGVISEVAVYPTALTATQVATLSDAKTEAYIDQLTSERVAYFLDNFTFPTSPPQNLETGQTTIDGPNSPTDGSVLAGIQVAAETENGVFFIAGNGDATFHDRDYRSTEQSSAAAVFGPANLGIYDIDLAFDDERIYNEVKIAPDDSTDPFISRDQDSIDAHGRRTFERTIYPADANEALDAANWLRAVYAEAATRIGTMRLRLGSDTALWPVVLGAEIGNRYTVNKATTGDDYSDDHYLESISMRISREKTWEVDWQLSPANDFTVWILGDDNLSILGDTTVLGY